MGSQYFEQNFDWVDIKRWYNAAATAITGNKKTYHKDVITFHDMSMSEQEKENIILRRQVDRLEKIIEILKSNLAL